VLLRGEVIRFEELSVAPTVADERRLNDALDQLLGGRFDPIRDRAALLVAELLSQDVGMAPVGERLMIRVFADEETLRVEVHDDGHGAVVRRIRQAPNVARHGWNPRLLNRLADRWGLVSAHEGAWVWFELAMPVAAS
jgi:hypothetical protein